MRRILPALLLFFAIAPALGAEDDAKTAGTHIDMPFLMAPMTGADGKLAGYAYISSRATASSDATANEVRDQIAFIQDVMVRDVNGVSVAAEADPEQVDVPRLEARLLADARKVMGVGKVKVITVCTVEVAELHPSQTQALSAPADAKDLDAHKNPVKSRCES